MASTQDIDDLIADFSFLDDWEDRYMHVIELGKNLAPLSEAERNNLTKVKGCVSQVWLVQEVSDDTPAIMTYRGDSDAHIVKGLVAIVLAIFSGRTAQAIVDIDATSILAKLGLAEHLTPQRSNGLHAMVARIKRDASELLYSQTRID
ncbi:MAG: SufE family protein [Robiginitomaculum sp.]|nr:SufE family protein [Robiginitomaculum sp.]